MRCFSSSSIVFLRYRRYPPRAYDFERCALLCLGVSGYSTPPPPPPHVAALTQLNNFQYGIDTRLVRTLAVCMRLEGPIQAFQSVSRALVSTPRSHLTNVWRFGRSEPGLGRLILGWCITRAARAPGNAGGSTLRVCIGGSLIAFAPHRTRCE